MPAELARVCKNCKWAEWKYSEGAKSRLLPKKLGVCQVQIKLPIWASLGYSATRFVAHNSSVPCPTWEPKGDGGGEVSMISGERIAVANRVLGCFQPSASFLLDGPRLMMRVLSHKRDGSFKDSPVFLRKDRHWFFGRLSNSYPGGGGSTMAACMLACWLRGWPRLPIDSWEYWAKPNGPGLLKRHPEAVEWLREAGYQDANCHCVLCGAPDFYRQGLDWWTDRDGIITGPCCGYGRCPGKIQ